MKKTKIITLLSVGLFSLTSCRSSHYNTDNYCKSLEWDGSRNFNILQITDLHLNMMMNRKKYFSILQDTVDVSKKRALSIEEPTEKGTSSIDLIVLTGDNFTFGTKAVAKEFFKFMDRQAIPWAITWGNHDEQCFFSMYWLTEYLNDLNHKRESDGSSYCVFRNNPTDDVFGDANYIINLDRKNANPNVEPDTLEQIYIFDSNRYNYNVDEYFGYDYIHTDQVEWYRRAAEDYSYINDEGEKKYTPSLSFFHIPFPEFEMAYVCAGGGTSYEGEKIDGDKKEGFDFLRSDTTSSDTSDKNPIRNYHDSATSLGDPSINTGLCYYMRNCNTTGVFVGHNHTSDYAVKVSKDAVFPIKFEDRGWEFDRFSYDDGSPCSNDITLSFGLKSNDRIYFDTNYHYLGAQIVSVHKPEEGKNKAPGTFDVIEVFTGDKSQYE